MYPVSPAKESHKVSHQSLLLLGLILLGSFHYSCKPQSSSQQSTSTESGTRETVHIARDSLPEGAPPWLKVRVQTTKNADQAVLETSGVVFGIQNRALAINAASSRALHEASSWLQTPNIQGLKVIDTAFSEDKFWAAARIQVPLPPNWTPPNPLPESKLP